MRPAQSLGRLLAALALSMAGLCAQAQSLLSVVYHNVVDERRPGAGSDAVTVEQLRELSDSGLVEGASHTYGSHRAILANPQGSRIPAVIARGYDDATGHYETGGDSDINSATLGRKYIRGGATLGDFAGYVTAPSYPNKAIHHLALPLDELVEPVDAKPVEGATVDRRLGQLLERLAALQLNTVLVSPFSSQCEAFYPTDLHKVSQDLLSRVTWQMHTRLRLRVYLDLEVVGCLSTKEPERELLAMTNAAPFDGLMLRTDGQAEARQVAQRMALAFAREEPNRPITGTEDFPASTRRMQRVDACSAGAQRAVNMGTAKGVEVDGQACTAKTALASLVRAGTGSIGLRIAAHKSLQAQDPEVLRLLTGIAE